MVELLELGTDMGETKPTNRTGGHDIVGTGKKRKITLNQVEQHDTECVHI
jgi:hypothetical protein